MALYTTSHVENINFESRKPRDAAATKKKLAPHLTMVPTYKNITMSETYQSLQQWDHENPQESVKINEHTSLIPGEMPNYLAKSEPLSAWRDLREANSLDADVTVAGADSKEGFEESSTMAISMQCKVGTLVEIRTQDSRIPLLGIIIHKQHGGNFIYTNTGQFLYKASLKPSFFIPDFFQPKELSMLYKYIPDEDADPHNLEDRQPQRTECSKLLSAMQEFIDESASIYHLNMNAIITAHDHIGDEDHHVYVSISELADSILSKSHSERFEKSRIAAKFDGAEKSTMRRHITPDIKKQFTTPAALYAVHRSIMEHYVWAFTITSIPDSDGNFLYEAIPLSWARDINFTEQQVRGMMEASGWPMAKTAPLNNSHLLQDFLQRAKHYIKISRESRSWSDHGTIGPITEKPEMPPPTFLSWKKSDYRFLRFIEIWSCYDQFPSGARLHSIGSQLLKLTEMYTEAELLSNSLGWTFMQEVREVVPWDIQARYTYRFPGMKVLKTRIGAVTTTGNDGMSESNATGYERLLEPEIEGSMCEDIAAGHRRSWDGANVFAIDEESTTLIDDAISLERIPGKSDEFWVHIHVADPAAFLVPNSPLSRWLEVLPQNVYLPGNLENMFPPEFVKNVVAPKFSLDKNRPCLTFSARVNNEGKILSSKIEPGILPSIIYIKGSEVSKAIPEDQRRKLSQDKPFIVGQIPKDISADRGMTSYEELNQAQKDDLAELQRLGEALHKERVARLGFPGHISRPQVYVATPRGSNHQQDAYIRISYFEGGLSGDVVSSHMQLAGQIAAKWCAERGIPAPYRTQPQAEERKSKIQGLWKKAFPSAPALLDKNTTIQEQKEAFSQLLAEAGAVELSTTPAPILAIGVDMYTKATSPLRRYTDLLLHWQIHGALAHERAEASASKKTPIKPVFSLSLLDRKLQAVRNRERIARRLEGTAGSRQWVLQALTRAWKFGQAELPATFKFTVDDVLSRMAVGSLDWFDQRAVATSDSLSKVVKRLAEVQKGDVFEVELDDVNIHSKTIKVKALKKLGA
ncbi:3'-5' RNA exonuclease complex component [Ceratocystis pirilliformis]|uniref:3'-5' RNA exonuclease complex component n=1 Tax=Ceratocystis pirilliformis TaxID=259994 RepID=A0ABR3ZM47_9PEZI